MDGPDTLVFDTGPLVHFAIEGWLGVLKAVVGPRTAVIPDPVYDELQGFAAKDARVAPTLSQPWLARRPLQTEEEIRAFAKFSSLLVHRDRNRGEAGVLALASCTGWRAVLDDLAGRKAATRAGMRHNGADA